MRIFCYGTLKRDGRAHSLITNYDSEFLGTAVTSVKYSLYNQGGYPGMVVQESENGVTGELFEVSDECIKALDRYEGVDCGLFKKETVELSDGSKAMSYLVGKPYWDDPITNGIWENK